MRPLTEDEQKQVFEKLAKLYVPSLGPKGWRLPLATAAANGSNSTCSPLKNTKGFSQSYSRDDPTHSVPLLWDRSIGRNIELMITRSDELYCFRLLKNKVFYIRSAAARGCCLCLSQPLPASPPRPAPRLPQREQHEAGHQRAARQSHGSRHLHWQVHQER